MEKIGNFQHDVKTEIKPWTHLNFGNRGEGEDFCFGIVSDRAGRPRPGVFEGALQIFNRMRPEFVMSVGDYIEGVSVEDYSEPFLRKQWNYILPEIRKCIPPFFFVAGNHDYDSPKEYFPGMHKITKGLWDEFFGVDYYSFIYKKVLFLCLNTNAAEKGLGALQTEWALKTIAEHSDVRWTFVFMHSPYFWDSEDFGKLEDALYERNYTVFAGDIHQYTKYVRNGRKYMMLGFTGCGEGRVGQGPLGVHFGEFDHVTWVSMCGEKPEFTHLALEGVYDENVVTTDSITWLTANYFRANKKIPQEEYDHLQTIGIEIERPEFGDWK